MAIFLTNMFLRKLLILLPLAFSSLYTIGQDGSFQLYQNGYYIKQYSELAGLVNNKCKYVFEDSRGFLWITTFQGLSRFDGQRFVNYGLKEGLPSIDISQVAEDTSGFIYIATAKGIARYTGRQANSDTCFYTYKPTTSLGSAISGMQVIDSSTIIFQRIGTGLYLLRKNKLQALGAEILNFEMSVYKDRENNIYAYTKDTFHVYNKYLIPVKKIPFPASNYMAFYYDNAEDIIHAYANQKSYTLTKNGLVYSAPAPDKIMWFWKDNINNRLYYFKDRTELFVREGNTDMPILDLENLSLVSNELRQARDKSLWVTTSAGGVLRITPLPYRETETRNGVCLRTVNNRSVLDLNNPLLPSPATVSKRLKNSLIRSVFTGKNKTVWYCTNDGIYKQDIGKNIEHYSFEGDESLYGISSREVKSVVEDAKGDMWFYGFCGMIRYSNGVFKQYTSRNGLNQGMLVRQLVIEKGGMVLLSDWYNLFRVQGDTLIKIDKELGLSNYVPNKIVTDKQGFVWIDYNKKILKLERQGTTGFRITDSIILPAAISANTITTFGFDGNNNCWIGYSGGSIQVFFAGYKGRYTAANSITYTIDDGLTPVTGNDYFLSPDSTGNMVILSRNNTNKVFVFSIANALERKKAISSQVCITEILVNQGIPDWASMGYVTDPSGLPYSPEFNFKKNDITFNYTSTSLSSRNGAVYQVMLSGYDGQWHTTTQTSVNYTNLPPGDYSFMLKTVNANGVWSNIVKYDFTILKPWYKTWWALSLWSFLITSTILLLFFLRLRALRKEYSLINLKKSNEFKTTLITLLGHDIIIPLQYIGKVAAQLKKYNDKLTKETLTESLEDIHLTASQLQILGESIVHWIKASNNESVPLSNKGFFVNDILNESAAFHLPIFAQKGNTIITEALPGLSFSQDPFLVKTIVHNLLSNANKFTTNGKVIVKATTENGRLIISVADSGKGMSKEKVAALNNFRSLDSSPGTNKEKGWGLGYIIILDLLKFSKGTLHVESGLDKGTTVTIQLPATPQPGSA